MRWRWQDRGAIVRAACRTDLRGQDSHADITGSRLRPCIRCSFLREGASADGVASGACRHRVVPGCRRAEGYEIAEPWTQFARADRWPILVPIRVKPLVRCTRCAESAREAATRRRSVPRHDRPIGRHVGDGGRRVGSGYRLHARYGSWGEAGAGRATTALQAGRNDGTARGAGHVRRTSMPRASHCRQAAVGGCAVVSEIANYVPYDVPTWPDSSNCRPAMRPVVARFCRRDGPGDSDGGVGNALGSKSLQAGGANSSG